MDATKVCFHRVTLTLVCLIFVLNGDVLGQEKITFEDHIKPMFRTRCAACHNPDKKNGDLDVTNYTSLMLGGGSGEVVVNVKVVFTSTTSEAAVSGSGVDVEEVSTLLAADGHCVGSSCGCKSVAPHQSQPDTTLYS